MKRTRSQDEGNKFGSTLLADQGYDADWIRELAMSRSDPCGYFSARCWPTRSSNSAVCEGCRDCGAGLRLVLLDRKTEVGGNDGDLAAGCPDADRDRAARFPFLIGNVCNHGRG